MIKEPTVLVLGAGARKPYGFPTGLELLRYVCVNLQRPRQRKILRANGFLDGEIDQFREALFYSGRTSVDFFLEHRPEFIRIGKASICMTLIPFEIESKLFTMDERANSWYEYLWTKLATDIDRFRENPLSILTFNYDRSLEQYLFTTLRNAYGLLDAKAAEVIMAIPIIHLHGRLGCLPWQSSTGRPYTADIEEEQLLFFSQQIKIISEGIGEDLEFNSALSLLKEAKIIYFLGFGWNEVNVLRLDINILKTKQVFGSTYNLGYAEIESLRSKWTFMFADPAFDVLGCLKNHKTLE